MAHGEKRDRRNACKGERTALTMVRRNHRPTCPACGAEPDRIEALQQEIITCRGCGLQTSAHEWSTHGQNPVANFTRATVVRSESSNGEIRWNIPAAGNAGVATGFWSLWCVAMAVFTAYVLERMAPVYGWLSLTMAALPIAAFAIGIIFLSQSLIRHYAQHTITLTKDTLVIRRDVLGRHNHTTFPRSRIKHIIRIPTSRSATRNHEAIEIRAGKQRVGFGGHLSPEEREKLVDELRLRVFGPPEPVADALPSTVRLPGKFSFLITHRMLHYLPFAIAAIMMGTLFMGVVLRFTSFEHCMDNIRDPMFFRVIEWVFAMLDNLMTAVFFLIALGMISGGIWMLIHSLRTHLRQTLLEGTPKQIFVRRLSKHGRTLSEKTYQTNESTAVRTSLQSITGGVTMKRLELVEGDDSTTIVSDIRAEDAEEIMRRLASSCG